jgi:hypothetical protein
VQRAVDKASEELSNYGAAEDVWADWEGITDALDSRQWLQQNVVITRGMVHAAAEAFAEAFKQVNSMVFAAHSCSIDSALGTYPVSLIPFMYDITFHLLL